MLKVFWNSSKYIVLDVKLFTVWNISSIQLLLRRALPPTTTLAKKGGLRSTDPMRLKIGTRPPIMPYRVEL